MGRKDMIEDKLAALRALEASSLSAEGEKLLRDALKSKNRELITAASTIIREHELGHFCEEMADAFYALLENAKKDKGCIAKRALIEALDVLQYEDDDLFLAGLRCTQPEPVWGGREDTAALVRANSAFALAKRRYPDILFHLADLMNDPDPAARRCAIWAIADMGDEKAELMLRVFGLQCQNEDDVVECLTAMMKCNPERSLPFVARFLEHKSLDVAESAALAIGSSREPEAFEILKRHYEAHITPERRDILLLPIALIRSDNALNFLLGVVREAHAATTERALKALAIFRAEEAARNAIRAAVWDRDEAALKDVYTRLFEEA